MKACSSRSTPKPRSPSPTTRPNITFQTYACPEAYAKWYCLNGATCFSVRIGESILYNCECADGFMGQRCEFKDLDGSYLPTKEKVLIETASVSNGFMFAFLLIVFLSIIVYTYLRLVFIILHIFYLSFKTLVIRQTYDP
ncbi:protein spitz-like protein [Leptotrombidium deliense]|uniref:Protein spitz-like protein n=1 Tax=Leptotrombidium deliense TaxID=299467 RepID=A0A443SUD9_9ACAR|nr:protein spitz-like protein [Leptotrombidium deliense]